MKKLTLLFCLLFPIASFAHDDGLDGKNIFEEIKKYQQNFSTKNFESMVYFVHPDTLNRFKDLTIENIEAEIRKSDYNFYHVFTAFDGFNDIEELKELSPSDYWVYINSVIFADTESQSNTRKIRYVTSSKKYDRLYINYKVKNSGSNLFHYGVKVLRKSDTNWRIATFPIGKFNTFLHDHVKAGEE